MSSRDLVAISACTMTTGRPKLGAHAPRPLPETSPPSPSIAATITYVYSELREAFEVFALPVVESVSVIAR